MEKTITNKVEKIDENTSYYITTTVVKRTFLNTQLQTILDQKLATLNNDKTKTVSDKDALIAEVEKNIEDLTAEIE